LWWYLDATENLFSAEFWDIWCEKLCEDGLEREHIIEER
jgi:hypothetical protein